MNKVVSEDALRRALQHMGEQASAAWLRPSLMHSVREVLEQPYLLRLRQTKNVQRLVAQQFAKIGSLMDTAEHEVLACLRDFRPSAILRRLACQPCSDEHRAHLSLSGL